MSLYSHHIVRKNKGSTDIHISKEWIGISRAFCVEYYYVDSMWRNWIIKAKKREGAAIIIIIGMVRLNEPGRRWEKKKKGGIRHGKIVGVPPYRRCAPSLWHRDAVCSCVWESDVIFPSVVTSNLRVAPPRAIPIWQRGKRPSDFHHQEEEAPSTLRVNLLCYVWWRFTCHRFASDPHQDECIVISI